MKTYKIKKNTEFEKGMSFPNFSKIVSEALVSFARFRNYKDYPLGTIVIIEIDNSYSAEFKYWALKKGNAEFKDKDGNILNVYW